MTITFPDFLQHCMTNPVFLIVVILTLGIILMNGWIDAPNAIATCVATRCMRPKAAVAMAAIFNFLGVLIMTSINANVVLTIYNLVDFGDNSRLALAALCAALIAIAVWCFVAWCFGIPSSQSHALIAGMSGAAIALQNGFSGLNGEEWSKVIFGLFLSLILGFAVGWVVVKIVTMASRNKNKNKTDRFYKGGQICSSAAMAFMHGAQDGQKFLGVFLLGVFLCEGQTNVGNLSIPLWLMILCSGVMSLGTLIGGTRIIKTIGMSIAKVEKYQGFSADLAATGCLLFCTLLGIPVSTTHTKSSAVMGVAAAKRVSSVKWGTVKNMILTWVMTFPGCGLIGFILAEIFIALH